MSDSEDEFINIYKAKKLASFRIRQAQLSEEKEALKKSDDAVADRILPRQIRLTYDNLYTAATDMFSSHEKSLITRYVSRGSEINSRNRNNMLTHDDNVFLREIKNSFKPIKYLFPENPDGDYIKVCRMQQREWDEDNVSALISTSNKCLRGFGSFAYTLLVQKDVCVGVSYLDLAGFPEGTIYEIIINPEQIIIHDLKTSSSGKHCNKLLVTRCDRELELSTYNSFNNTKIACFGEE